MTPPNHVTTTMLGLIFSFIASPQLLVLAQNPYYFNPYQPQHQPQYQQPTYQPFTNAPQFYQPSYQSPDDNYYNSALSPTPPAANPLITYPTQSEVTHGPQGGHFNHLSPQPFQPIGNSLVQQTPTNPTTTLSAGTPYRAPFSNHHTHIVNGLPSKQFFGNNYEFFRTRHGLTPTHPSLTQLNTLGASAAPQPQPSPTPAAAVASTSAASVQPTKAAETKENAVKQVATTRAPPPPPSPPSTFPSLFSRFPNFGPGSPFSPIPNHSVNTATTPAPRAVVSVTTTRPPPPPRPTATTAAPAAVVSPAFTFSQYFPQTDPQNSNELERQPLFEAEEDEEVEDDDDAYGNNNSNNGNSLYRQPQQLARIVPQSPQRQQQQPVQSSSPFRSQQSSPFNSFATNVNSLSGQSKDEPTPIRVHNTTPIRIVFNYEQALEALQENPGVRVVIARTEKNNLTEEEFTTSRPYQVPFTTTSTTTPRSFSTPTSAYQTTTRPYSDPYSYQTSPRYTPDEPQNTRFISSTPEPYQSSPRTNQNYYQPTQEPYQSTPRSVNQNYYSSTPETYQSSPRSVNQNYYQSTTSRPVTSNFGTHRPVVRVPQTTTTSTTTPRPRAPPTSRFEYEYEPLNVPYTTTAGTTGAALETLALELEGRFSRTGRPSPQPLYETVATVATEPTTTETPYQTVRRGSKKYVVVPSARNVYKVQEPRVVVNDLASIVVQTLPPRTRYSPAPTQPTYLRNTFPEYDSDDELGQPVGDDLRQEIENLSEQLQQEIQTTEPPTTTTTTSTTTTTTPRPPPPPPPRIRVSPTPRLLKITTYRPPGTYRTSPRPSSPNFEDDSGEEQAPEAPEDNSLSSEPPTQSRRNQQPPQPPRYYYNNKQRTGLSGAHQRYEYNGVDADASPSSTPPSPPAPSGTGERRRRPVVRRRQRVRGRLIAGSPPRPVQVSPGQGPLGPVIGPDGIPPQISFGPISPGGVPLGPNGPLSPVPAGVSVPGTVFRVGPRGRLLRRKIRPRPQIIESSTESQQSPSPSPSSPSGVPDLPPVPQELSPDNPPPPPGPSSFSPLYNPTPFVPTSVPLGVTTFRPGSPNLLVQQNLADEDEDERNSFRSRFRFNPTRPTAPSTTTRSRSTEEGEDDNASNQYDSEEDAPAPVPQRRRPQFSTTTTSTEKPSASQVISDRANILQRQIRFNRNRAKNNNKNNN